VTLPETHSIRLAEAVRDQLRQDHRTLATLESCTGGLIASILTDVPGAGYLVGAGVAYSVPAKEKFGVPPGLIERHGVVSTEVAAAMARAAADWFGAELGLAITGVAGPDPEDGVQPGSAFAAVFDRYAPAEVQQLWVPGERRQAKLEMAHLALGILLEHLDRFRSQGVSQSVASWIGR
jgi:PncC family amidohydrolase